MNLSMENYEIRGPLDPCLIDRLVDGELPEAQRRQLLLRLETETDGWRRCALAFLEAQNWRQALAPLAASACAVPRPVILPERPGRKRSAWQSFATLTALAASLVAAFTLGWALHRSPWENPNPDSMAQEKPIPSPPVEPLKPPEIDLAAQDPPLPSPRESSSPLDPVVKQWEQRGYHAERQERLVSMKLPDGRKVEVPVHEVRLKYIGDRTY